MKTAGVSVPMLARNALGAVAPGGDSALAYFGDVSLVAL